MMRFFYMGAATLVIFLFAVLVWRDMHRPSGAPIVKEMTALPVFWLEQGCDKEWFKHPLVSSLLDTKTNGIVCTYSGEIRKAECNASVLLSPVVTGFAQTSITVVTNPDAQLECHQRIRKKLLKKIAIKEEAEKIEEAEAPPKQADCEKTWGDANLLRVDDHMKHCTYSGIIQEEQCAKYQNVQIVHNGSWQCRQKTPDGYWKYVQTIRKTKCDSVWLGNPLQTQSVDMDQTKKCQYSGVVDISVCHAHPGTVTIIKPEGGSQCVLSTAGPKGGGVMQTIGMR